MDLIEEGYEHAIASLRRNVTDLGFTAAAVDHEMHPPSAQRTGSYDAVWARDGVLTAIWSATTGDAEFIDCGKRTLELLAKHQTSAGMIPVNVHSHTEHPEYSGLGGIASIDAVIWFVIGVVRLAFGEQDPAFARRLLPSVTAAMHWLEAHDSNDDALLELPESSDWMDLFPRSYNVLYDEVLWYQACLDYAALLQGLGEDGTRWHNFAQRVLSRCLEVFWPTYTEAEWTALGSSGRRITGEPQYLLSYVTPYDFSWRCDVYGNLLAALNGMLDQPKRERLFSFLWGAGVDQPYPVRVLYPPVQSGADDWKDYFILNFLNLPYHYHNGGVWPFVGGLWVRFLYSMGRADLAQSELGQLAEACRQGIHGEWEFNEWLHGKTGRPMGKPHQAWSAASYIKTYLALKGDSSVEDFLPLVPASLNGFGAPPP